jgi:hypothetical protein
MMKIPVILDFSWALSFLTASGLLVTVAVWLRQSASGSEKSRILDPKYVWVCSVCTYNYVNTKEESISSCPRCGSYNKR